MGYWGLSGMGQGGCKGLNGVLKFLCRSPNPLCSCIRRCSLPVSVSAFLCLGLPNSGSYPPSTHLPSTHPTHWLEQSGGRGLCANKVVDFRSLRLRPGAADPP